MHIVAGQQALILPIRHQVTEHLRLPDGSPLDRILTLEEPSNESTVISKPVNGHCHGLKAIHAKPWNGPEAYVRMMLGLNALLFLRVSVPIAELLALVGSGQRIPRCIIAGLVNGCKLCVNATRPAFECPCH
jgi:hypothetical protein